MPTGTTPFKTGSAPEEYSTSLIGNYTMAWIRHVTADKDHPPFFAAMGPHAPHLPSTPAAWYKQKWPQGLEVTKLPSYNVSAPDHHWIVSMQPILNEDDAKGIREEYTNRHRTLLSVDDIVREVAEYLKEIGEWDNTYFFYTSDHGCVCQGRDAALCLYFFGACWPEPPIARISFPLPRRSALQVLSRRVSHSKPQNTSLRPQHAGADARQGAGNQGWKQPQHPVCHGGPGPHLYRACKGPGLCL